MNVKELIAVLETFPKDLEVITTRCSDYDWMRPRDFNVVNAVPQDWGIMRSHKTMSEENKKKEGTFLHIDGGM